MPRPVDALVRIFGDHQVLFRHGDRSDRRIRGAVPHAIVRTARVVFGPEEVIGPLAVEDARALAEGAVRRDDLERVGIIRHHVVVQFHHGHVAIAPIEIVLATDRIVKHGRIDLLASSNTGWPLVDQRLARILEGPGWGVRDSHADPLRCGEVIVVFVSVALLLLDATRGPRIAIRPGHIGFEIEDDALISPIHEIRGREGLEVRARPPGETIARGIQVILLGLVRVDNVRVGIVPRQHGVVFDGGKSFRHAPFFCHGLELGPRDRQDRAVTGVEVHGDVIVDDFEVQQIAAPGELIAAPSVHIVHQNPFVSMIQFEYAGALHRVA